jgi:hypothetical protein
MQALLRGGVSVQGKKVSGQVFAGGIRTGEGSASQCLLCGSARPSYIPDVAGAESSEDLWDI